MRPVVLLALLIPLGCAADPRCPPGWHDNGICEEPPGLTEELARTMGSGAFGYARIREGDCSLDPDADCRFRLVADLEIRAFAAGEVLSGSGGPACQQGFRATDAVPVGVTRTDGNGVYHLPLPPGRYAMTAIDPVTRCPFLAGHAEPTAGVVSRVIFHFDHAAD